jgi:hypothetical protein
MVEVASAPPARPPRNKLTGTWPKIQRKMGKLKLPFPMGELLVEIYEMFSGFLEIFSFVGCFVFGRIDSGNNFKAGMEHYVRCMPLELG